MEEHDWFIVQFSHGSWIECRCGYRPNSQEEMDDHYMPEGVL